VHRKPTDTGVLLHYQSHVDGRYKRSLLNTMLNRAFKLSSSWNLFHKKCERLKEILSRLCYPDNLVQTTIRKVIASKLSEVSHIQQMPGSKNHPSESCCLLKAISANAEHRQLADLSRTISADITPAYASRKMKDKFRVKEDKLPLVDQKCVVYNFQCSLCYAIYVGYTCRHLHQPIEEHMGSTIDNHLREQHSMAPVDFARCFNLLRKCQNKLHCLIFEKSFIKELKPTLNKQCDSTHAKLFV